MKLYIRQKVFSWGDRFTVKDAAGEDRYAVQGEAFSLGKKLHVEAFCTHSEGVEKKILDVVKKIYPHLEIAVSTERCNLEQRPAYLGKRHIIQK